LIVVGGVEFLGWGVFVWGVLVRFDGVWSGRRGGGAGGCLGTPLCGCGWGRGGGAERGGGVDSGWVFGFVGVWGWWGLWGGLGGGGWLGRGGEGGVVARWGGLWVWLSRGWLVWGVVALGRDCVGLGGVGDGLWVFSNG